MKHLVIIFSFLLIQLSIAQEEKTYTSHEVKINTLIEGTLLKPNSIEKPNLAIIIAGSGPTDRDGNQNFLKTDNLKKLAIGLTNNNIASFRYDKRVVMQIRKGNVAKDIMFSDFITDASDVIRYFKESNQFKSIYIIGHSQGSLVGMVAAKGKADGFISLAGAGQSIDQVIIEQVEKTAPQFKADTERIFGVLAEGKTTKDFPVALGSIFNLDVQPFIANWMSYKPETIIKDLDIPILIINGTKDLQVSEAEAQLLHKANPKSKIKIIPEMNHVLVTIEGDDLENSKSYNEPYRKLADSLITTITDFINK